MKSKDIWLLGVGLLVAGAAALWIIKNSGDDEKPPKGAPQLDVENPGTQDDFPKRPVEFGVG